MDPILAEFLTIARDDRADGIFVGADRRVMLRAGRSIMPANRVLTEAEVEGIIDDITDDPARGELAKTGSTVVSLGATVHGNVRVAIYTADGLKVLGVRVLGREAPDAVALGVPEHLRALADSESGLLIVSGPQKNSKTTTSHALLSEMNANFALPRRIAIVDDVIEYRHESKACTFDNITIGRGRDAPSRAAAVKTLLKADIQVISLGEFRATLDEAAAVIDATEAGMLVLCNTHAGDPARAIERILDPFPPAEAHRARAVLAQHLVASIGVRLARVENGDPLLVTSVLYGTAGVATSIREADVVGLINAMDYGPHVSFEKSFAEIRGRVPADELDRLVRSVQAEAAYA